MKSVKKCRSGLANKLNGISDKTENSTPMEDITKEGKNIDII